MNIGGLAERSNASVLKTEVRETVTGVRIPKPPQTLGDRSNGRTQDSDS